MNTQSVVLPVAAKIFSACIRYGLTIWAASVLVFVLLRVVPGDPAEIALGISATEELLAAKRAELGTDRPLVMQYLSWIGGIFHGDFGVSLSSGMDLSPVILDRLQVSLILVGCGLLVALAIAIPLGSWAAYRARHLDGYLIAALSQVGIAVPSFLAGILLVSLWAVHLDLLPAGGWVPPSYSFSGFVERLILPVLALAAVQGAMLTRYVRTAVLEIIGDDFMRTARAKGLSPLAALRRHGLRAAALPVLTVTGVQLATVVVGAVVIERVFVLPGLGSLLLDSVTNRDLPAVQSIVMILVLFTLMVNLVVDIAYLLLDPRVRGNSAR